MATSLEALVALLRGRRIAVLTGAGISTESGIPDYRGPETRRRARNPIQGREFVTSEEARRRYWARALLGWRRFADNAPAAGHLALAELERRGLLCGVVTQNVDRLHHAAQSRRIIELHGSLHEVICLTCGALTPREPLQAALEARNRGWSERWLARRVEMAPDGDAELDDVTSKRLALSAEPSYWLSSPGIAQVSLSFAPAPAISAFVSGAGKSQCIVPLM